MDCEFWNNGDSLNSFVSIQIYRIYTNEIGRIYENFSSDLKWAFSCLTILTLTRNWIVVGIADNNENGTLSLFSSDSSSKDLSNSGLITESILFETSMRIDSQ